MEAEHLVPFLFHPYTWERWVPAELLDTWLYHGAVGFGYEDSAGWFVLEKNEETSKVAILHVDDPTAEIAPKTIVPGPKYAVANPKVSTQESILKIEGTVVTADILEQVYGVHPMVLQRIPQNKKLAIPAKSFLLFLERIHPKLYRVHETRPVSPNTA